MSQPVNSVHHSVCQAIAALLLVAPVLALGNVVANRKRPMPLGINSQIFVYFEESSATRGEIRNAPVDWRTRVRVECVARDVPGQLAETTADAMGVQVYARVMADVSLGGLALDVIPLAVGLAADEADAGLAAYQLMFEVWHRSQEGSIAAA